jgi:ParB/RepB/Spo0J family partition protein
MVIYAESIEQIKTNKLKPYDKNPRTHSATQIERLVESLKEFGFTNPILIDDKYNIIAGHGRLEAAKILGLETVPTIKLDHLSPEQRRAYVIADNQLALNAAWDDELLQSELNALSEIGYDLTLLG